MEPTSQAARPFAAFAAAFALALLAHQLWWRGVPAVDLHGLVVALAAWVLARPAAPAGWPRWRWRRSWPSRATCRRSATTRCWPRPPRSRSRRVRDRRRPRARGCRGRRGCGSGSRRSCASRRCCCTRRRRWPSSTSGFLDAATSCAGPLAAELAFFDPSLLDGRWHVGPAIAATIVAEAGLAVSLAISRTRVAAVVVGASFHAVLALAGNVPFAAYALALYVAFLPAAAVPAWRVPLRSSAAIAAGLVLAAALAEPPAVRDALQLGLRLLVAAGLVAFAVAVARRRHGDRAVGRVRALRPVYAAVALVLVVNAASPYVGLKTEASFAMFSNLQTEPGHWNHLVVPEAVRVFGAQDELVRLDASNAPTLERRRRAGTLMVRFELERYLREQPGAWATYTDVPRPDAAIHGVGRPRCPTARSSTGSSTSTTSRQGARGRC
jgi:hypothetical protein